MTDRQQRFISLLNEIFELDKSDLDFGIYRIMAIRRAEIQDFFAHRLPQTITHILRPFAEAGADLAALENDVYATLYNFFSRYYDEGDFISKRRYKEGVYAIPYEGEEVKLYWANQDQYYIKTGENFRDYTFHADSLTVHFLLTDATTEQNNNKENTDGKRTFMLFSEDPERPELKTFAYDADSNALTIRFVYNIPADKKAKYDELNLRAITDYIANHQPQLTPVLLRKVNAADSKSPTVVEKHLKTYVAKNTFDYFIHKDLGGFLSRELDFFIKNELMHLDDLDTDNEAHVESYLAKVKAVKRVGKTIIDFLAQTENFQKRLWLKKKFVVDTQWCITLDKIDERFYPEIAANAAQMREWEEMYAVQDIPSDLTHEAWSNPPTIDFLRQNPYLLVDTRHFPADFTQRLLATIDNLDQQTNGVMINADNFHALRFLSKTCKKGLDCIYIDPPYNSPSSEIVYKNDYKHSSWLSLINTRLYEAKKMLNTNGSISVAIDKYEHGGLYMMMEDVFSDYDVVSVAIEHNKKGTQGDHFSFNNEYAVFAVSYGRKNLNTVIRPKEEWEWSAFRNWGSESERKDAKNCFFPVFVSDDEIIGYGAVCDDEFHPAANEIMPDTFDCYDWKGNQVSIKRKGIIAVYPIDNGGTERKWRYAFQTMPSIIPFLRIKQNRTGEKIDIEMPKYSDQYKTFWYDSKYNAGDYGTKVLTNMGIPKELFKFPKSVYTTKDCVYAISENNSNVLDFFAGSGTTGHAVIALNRENEDSNRKYILVEMGSYFNTVTLPRIKKVVYSADWRDGKPTARETGVSQIVKYMRLESYEDALNNIELRRNDGIQQLFGDDYLIRYMLDLESKESLLNLDAFRSPFDYTMRITEHNEARETVVDVVETFNYLIGLTVQSMGPIRRFRTVEAEKPMYEGAVDLRSDSEGPFVFRQLDGTLPDGRRALVIWRTITGNLLLSNAALDAFFLRNRINPQDREYDIIFVNGDSNLENLRLDDEHWKVQRTEEEFNRKMWEE